MTGLIMGKFGFMPLVVANGFEITVIFTDVPENERRIISAWRAERHEREAYWQSIG